MDKGYSVVVGMTLAYAVSFFGMLLAYIVYQRNHNENELWRRRPVGVSFFSAVYGYIIPAVFVLNALLTLFIKIFRGWDFNAFVWTNQALGWPLAAAALLYWLVGRHSWRLDRWLGYGICLLLALAGTAALLAGTVSMISARIADLHIIGSYVTALIWHVLWSVYFIRAGTRTSFFQSSIPTS
ncbi:MAG: hypothetical protein FVQ81_02880 [Candidatus Glassbacteria bacterium]|nr:hypothetical protein [Candidatus Glassbacteria bacterium]